MNALWKTFLTHGSAFLTLSSRLRGRPFLVNLGSLLERVPFRPLEVNCLYFLEYEGTPPRQPHLLRGPGEVRAATLRDLEGLAACQNRPRVFLERFRAQDDCVVAVVDGRIVGYQWFCTRAVYVEERYEYELEVPPDAVYEYDVFILPEYRLAGIWFKFHCLYLRDLMQRRHRQRIIGMVDYGNRLSMNTHLRFGFRIFRRVVVVKLFGRSISMGGDRRSDGPAQPRWLGRPEKARLRSSVPSPLEGVAPRACPSSRT